MEKIKLLALAFVLTISSAATAQDLDDQRGGFKKENLFTGGSVSFGFTGYSFQLGANPMFGYSIAPWIDAGVVGNINYASFRDVYIVNANDKIRETTYGAGAFTRIYPLRFLFAQAQFEHNFISEKFIPGNGATIQKNKVEANSLLVGAGYTSDRYPGSGRPFFYLSLLFDVLDGEYSPYTKPGGGILPIFRAGVQVPLFQKSRDRY